MCGWCAADSLWNRHGIGTSAFVKCHAINRLSGLPGPPDPGLEVTLAMICWSSERLRHREPWIIALSPRIDAGGSCACIFTDANRPVEGLGGWLVGRRCRSAGGSAERPEVHATGIKTKKITCNFNRDEIRSVSWPKYFSQLWHLCM